MSIADQGYALSWPNEVEFSADSLWYKAHPQALVPAGSAVARA